VFKDLTPIVVVIMW